VKIVFYGVRGTSPVTQPGFQVFGGETTCLAVEGKGGGRLILDAGTGIRAAGHVLRRDPRDFSVSVLLTHYHLDHLMGVMSFAPLYDKRWSVEFVGPLLDEGTPEQAITILLGKPFWPVQVRTLPSQIRFTTLPVLHPKEPMSWAGLTVRCAPVHHSEGCTAYRIEEPCSGRAFVFATDLEWGASSESEREVFFDLCVRPVPVDLLVMDGQFTRANYESHRGWGHSTIEDIVEITGRLDIKTALITHHSPEADDRRLEEAERELETVGGTIRLARQGLEVVLL